MAGLSMPAPHAAAGAGGRGGEWFERLARVGIGAKGVVYITVGTIAAAAARGGGAATGSEGALRAISDAPLGRALIAFVALGLAGYVLWRVASAIFDPEDDGPALRVFHFVTAVVYAGLVLEAIRMALSSASGGGADAATHWTARAMAQPFGVIGVAIVGVAVGLYGVLQIYRAVTADLGDRLDLRRLSSAGTRWVVRVGRAGLAARGVVLGIMGLFLVIAALRTDPTEARGLGGALRAVERQPWGPWLLLAVAVGLVAYGLFQLVKARYRRIGRPAPA